MIAQLKILGYSTEDTVLPEAAFQVKNNGPILIHDDELNLEIRNLNQKRKEIFSIVLISYENINLIMNAGAQNHF